MKYLTAALLSLTIAAAVWAYILFNRLAAETQRNAQLTQTVQQYAAVIEEQAAAKRKSEAALSARLRAAHAEATKRKEERDALRDALAKAPDWADRPLPDSIADWLRNPTAAGPAGAGSPAR